MGPKLGEEWRGWKLEDWEVEKVVKKKCVKCGFEPADAHSVNTLCCRSNFFYLLTDQHTHIHTHIHTDLLLSHSSNAGVPEGSLADKK